MKRFGDTKLDSGGMKGGVDATKSGWKIETDCRGAYHLDNAIRTTETWVHLSDIHFKG